MTRGAEASRAPSARPDERPAYLAPKRARRGYGERFLAADAVRRRSSPVGARPTLQHVELDSEPYAPLALFKQSVPPSLLREVTSARRASVA
jgi:hypothetical protein